MPEADPIEPAPALEGGPPRPAPIVPILTGLTLLGATGLVAYLYGGTEPRWVVGLVLVGGSVNAFFLSLVMQLARTGRWRSQRLLAANARLVEEVARRARAESAEQDAVDELGAVVDSFPDHVWSAELSGDALVPRYYSGAIGRIAGRPAEGFRDDPLRWLDVVHVDDRESVAAAYQSLREGADGLSLEYRIERPDGEIRWVRDRVRVTRKAGRRWRYDGVITDVTDMKREEAKRLRLESSFQEAQKLESLGVLAGGIAHDFNNLLVGVLGQAHLALQDLSPDSRMRASIERIERAARRAAELCRQLLAYAGKGSFVIEPLDVREVVEEMGDLLAASTSKKVSIDYDFGDRVPPIEADASQIRQLVLNLITNASEAIGDRGGVIALSTRAVGCGPDELRDAALGEDLAPGSYVELVVSDDGCGMEEETKRRLFEPFYSTKFAGRGLGLAAVLGIVRAHRGGIRVKSEPGRGTSITLLFPALTGRLPRSRPGPHEPEPWHGSGTLLLVDDEPDVLEVGRILLERAGFEVLTATDGAAALEVFRERKDRIACVLLDLTMPSMDGEETHRRLRSIRPDVPVVLCSGYPEQEAVRRFRGQGLAGFLGKPYTPEAMLAAVQRVLERISPA